MQLVLLGPPGAGKGTQADLLMKKLFLPHISTGEMFRSAVKAATPLGLEAKSYTDKGELVPDAITIGIIKDRLSQADCREGFLLDGFPRTLPQGAALEQLLAELEKPLTAAINIDVPIERLVKRLTGRRMCKSCGAIFHQYYNAPRIEGTCDNCENPLIQRDDDNEETFKRRLVVYEKETAPLIEFYATKNLLVTVNGDQPMKDVMLEIGRALGQNWS